MDIRSSGTGPPVLLVHGSMLGGRPQWMAQGPLTKRWELLVADRAGYRRGDVDVGENWGVDAVHIGAELQRRPEGVHLVGFSYGAVGAMFAASQWPDRVRSLTLIEPSTWSVAFDVVAVQTLYDSLIGAVVEFDGDDGLMAQAFLERVGARQRVRTDRLPASLAQGVRAVARGRPSGQAHLPLAALAALDVPKLVVSGGHHAAFEVIGDRVAAAIDARRERFDNVGHGVPAVGTPLNVMLEEVFCAGEGEPYRADAATGTS